MKKVSFAEKDEVIEYQTAELEAEAHAPETPRRSEIEFSVSGGSCALGAGGGVGGNKNTKTGQGPGGPTRIATGLVQKGV